jgi:hypothetical protein
MIKFARIQAGKEGDRLELLRVATLNGGLLALMRKIDFKANELAETMALAHGGEWKARVDHQRMTVLVWRADAE